MNKNWLDHRRLAEAFAFAASVHREQVRKSTTIPYVSHLMALAALLHDAIEDGGAEYEPVIRNLFGDRVATIVRACTDADVTPKPPWRARKEAYIRHLREEGPDALLVSACDKLHNARAIVADLRAIGPRVFERFNAGRDGTLWYYKAMAEVFLERLPGPVADELARTVAGMQEMASTASTT